VTLFPSLRLSTALLVLLLAACAAGDPIDPAKDPTATDSGTDGPVAVSPRQVTLEGKQGVLFQAFESLIPGSNQVTSIEWTATGGTIDAQGSYTPNTTGAFKIVGRRKGNKKNPPDTSIVVVVPPQPALVALSLTPKTATVGGGLQQQFAVVGRRSDGTEVPVGVNWTASGGTIDAGGLYTAGRTPGTYKVIAKHVTTGLADTAVVTVPAATLVGITLSPSSVSLGEGQSRQFTVTGRLSDGSTSTVPVAYSASGGNISVTGYYTAGSAGGSYRVIATAQNGKADTSSVIIAASAPPPSSAVLYNADFEGGSWPTSTGIIQCVPGRITIFSASSKPYSSAPNPRLGNRAAAFRTMNTDTYPCTPSVNARSQAESPKVFANGGEYWEAWSVYIPTDFPTLSGWMMLREDYSALGGGEPALGFYINNGSITFNANYNAVTMHNTRVATLPMPKGVWLDFLLHVKVSDDPSDGFVELWYSSDGGPVKNVVLTGGSSVGGVSRLVCQTMLAAHAAGGGQFIMNNYRDPAAATQTIIYFDEAKVGTTRAAVEIP
jgi:hypothetical protein